MLDRVKRRESVDACRFKIDAVTDNVALDDFDAVLIGHRTTRVAGLGVTRVAAIIDRDRVKAEHCAAHENTPQPPPISTTVPLVPIALTNTRSEAA